MYLYIGRMIALSILHGGPGPVFLSPVIVDYLFGGISAVNPCVNDVADEILQSKIRKVHYVFSNRHFIETAIATSTANMFALISI